MSRFPTAWTLADFQFAVTFPFHPYKDGRKGGEVTVIREYAQVRLPLAWGCVLTVTACCMELDSHAHGVGASPMRRLHVNAISKPHCNRARTARQGPNCLMYCLPTGGFDRRKHSGLEDCAKAELSEEVSADQLLVQAAGCMLLHKPRTCSQS